MSGQQEELGVEGYFNEGKFPQWVNKYLGDTKQYVIMDVAKIGWNQTHMALGKYLGNDEGKYPIENLHGSRYEMWVDRIYVNDAKGEKPKFKSNKEVKLSGGPGLFKTEFHGKTIFILCRHVGDWVVGEDGVGWIEDTICFIKQSDFADRAAAREHLNDFAKFVHSKHSGDSGSKQDFIIIYNWDAKRGYYAFSGYRLKRSVESVFLPNEVKHKLLNDLKRFMTKKTLDFYVNHGIPYRRSYLFYGKPGTGKTSMIQALASAFERSIAIISLGSPDLTDDGLASALSSQNWFSGPAVFVIEDIDAFFDKDRTSLITHGSLTFTGLLNCLDGVNSSAGHLIVMTTNHPEKLDAALIRNGRVDLAIEFPLSSPETIHKMFLSFYPDNPEEATKFTDIVYAKYKDGVSLALLQQHFLRHMDSDAKTAMEAAREEIDASAFDFTTSKH
jgi:chaperone BCS1